MTVNLTFQRTWRGGAASAAMRAAAPEASTAGAEFIKARAIPRTPKDLGDLRGSYVIKPGEGGETWIIVDSIYAAIQHEADSFHHDEGEAHYLSNTLREERKATYAIMAAVVRRRLAGA